MRWWRSGAVTFGCGIIRPGNSAAGLIRLRRLDPLQAWSMRHAMQQPQRRGQQQGKDQDESDGAVELANAHDA